MIRDRDRLGPTGALPGAGLCGSLAGWMDGVDGMDKVDRADGRGRRGLGRTGRMSGWRSRRN